MITETVVVLNRTDLLLTNPGMKKRTRMGFFNVRTLCEPSRLQQVARKAEKYKVGLMELSDVRWNGNGEVRL
jgi:hypothetical protein